MIPLKTIVCIITDRIIYYFHMNTNKRCHSKVRPPRLDGQSCGLFASRSPHRPNPLGLSLAKLDSVKDGLVFVSGIDILDGTPIIDIKPYIKQYDSPDVSTDGQQTSETCDSTESEDQE
ncbi:unnamed protein product, partial [Oppiella nova]